MTTMPAHDVWHVGMDMSAAMPIGMAITTVASTDGMAGARSTTHGTILHGMVLAIGMTHGMTHGTTDTQDGTVDGMVGDHITLITTIGDGMDTIIRFMAAEAVGQDTTALVVLVLPTTAMVHTDVLNLHSVLAAASVRALPTETEPAELLREVAHPTDSTPTAMYLTKGIISTHLRYAINL